SRKEPSDKPGAVHLYRAFGVALIATGMGMFLRLALLQFYRSAEDQESQAVDELDKRLAALLQTLSDCERAVRGWVDEFAGGVRAEGNQLVESITDTRKAISAAVRPLARIQ